MFDTLSTTDLFLRIFGLYCLATGLGAVVQPDYFERLMRELQASQMHRLTAGFMAFLVGVTILSVHRYDVGWTGALVAVIGWMALIKGLVFLSFPKGLVWAASRIETRSSLLRFAGLAVMVIGAGLFWLGYNG